MATLTEDRILDFLDGRLTSGEEEELLHTLAVSPERRTVLRAHLRLREITSNIANTDAFTVPKHVTSGLFRTLGTMGLKTTATTEEILTHAPQLAKVAAAGKVMSGAIATSAVAGAVANAGGWHTSVASIIGATLLSFSLGLGAYHVFANGIGVHPLGEKAAVPMAALQEATTSIQHNALGEPASRTATPASSHEAPLSPITMRYLTPLPIDGNALHIEYPFDAGEPIPYAAPLEKEIAPAMDAPARLASQRVLVRAIESPVESPNGTISLRYGTGLVPTNNIASLSSLEEMKFRWTAWDYVVGEASFGQLQTYMHQAVPPNRSVIAINKQIEIGTTRSNNFVMGVEGGVTLDPIHLPIEATVGIMTDGVNSFYRSGLFGHYEPFEAMSIIFGFEGVWFSNDIGASVANVSKTYSNFISPNATVKGPTGSETVGFFGPSIEFGWHF